MKEIINIIRYESVIRKNISRMEEMILNIFQRYERFIREYTLKCTLTKISCPKFGFLKMNQQSKNPQSDLYLVPDVLKQVEQRFADVVVASAKLK